VDLAPWSTGNIQQVEIVRGPLSAVYGSDSVSGVVNFVSRRGESQPSLDMTSGCSFWTRSVGVNTAGLLGKFDYSFNGSSWHRRPSQERSLSVSTVPSTREIALTGDKFCRLPPGLPIASPKASRWEEEPEYSIVQQPQHRRSKANSLLALIRSKGSSFWSYGIAFDFFDRGQSLAIPAILDRMPPSLQSIPATHGTTSFQR